MIARTEEGFDIQCCLCPYYEALDTLSFTEALSIARAEGWQSGKKYQMILNRKEERL